MFVILIMALALALLVAAWLDLRSRLIPNWLTLSIALAAPLWWWSNGLPFWPDAALQVGLALIVFTLFAGLFALGAMGGGDVKLIAALALWLPLEPLLRMLVVIALAGGVVTIATLVWHRRTHREGTPEIPYGVAISCAGLWVFTNQLLTISAP